MVSERLTVILPACGYFLLFDFNRSLSTPDRMYGSKCEDATSLRRRGCMYAPWCLVPSSLAPDGLTAGKSRARTTLEGANRQTECRSPWTTGIWYE
ncbi:hypothetical protein B0T19DRAFT_425590 [Cercophora scortea]|uniref:Uncharacterized protein n=1 Tax=Cercophora scortea TaxID=314031 RepID=A0AAE0IE06_9PEZI|nr:hypothetical protein B0T19DRAFT_425590 [Cercophora scortea]